MRRGRGRKVDWLYIHTVSHRGMRIGGIAWREALYGVISDRDQALRKQHTTFHDNVTYKVIPFNELLIIMKNCYYDKTLIE